MPPITVREVQDADLQGLLEIYNEVPTVIFEEENSDGWKDFVEHAKAAGSPFVTMSEVILEKADVALLPGRHLLEQGLLAHQLAAAEPVHELPGDGGEALVSARPGLVRGALVTHLHHAQRGGGVVQVAHCGCVLRASVPACAGPAAG